MSLRRLSVQSMYRSRECNGLVVEVARFTNDYRSPGSQIWQRKCSPFARKQRSSNRFAWGKSIELRNNGNIRSRSPENTCERTERRCRGSQFVVRIVPWDAFVSRPTNSSTPAGRGRCGSGSDARGLYAFGPVSRSRRLPDLGDADRHQRSSDANPERAAELFYFLGSIGWAIERSRAERNLRRPEAKPGGDVPAGRAEETRGRGVGTVVGRESEGDSALQVLRLLPEGSCQQARAVVKLTEAPVASRATVPAPQGQKPKSAGCLSLPCGSISVVSRMTVFRPQVPMCRAKDSHLPSRVVASQIPRRNDLVQVAILSS